MQFTSVTDTLCLEGSTSSYSSQVGSDDPANRSAGSVAGSEDSTTSSGDSTASSYNSTTGCFSPAPKQKKPIVHEHRELVYDPPRGRRLDNQRERYR